jgi:hypothetical protein
MKPLKSPSVEVFPQKWTKRLLLKKNKGIVKNGTIL